MQRWTLRRVLWASWAASPRLCWLIVSSARVFPYSVMSVKTKFILGHYVCLSQIVRTDKPSEAENQAMDGEGKQQECSAYLHNNFCLSTFQAFQAHPPAFSSIQQLCEDFLKYSVWHLQNCCYSAVVRWCSAREDEKLGALLLAALAAAAWFLIYTYLKHVLFSGSSGNI